METMDLKSCQMYLVISTSFLNVQSLRCLMIIVSLIKYYGLGRILKVTLLIPLDQFLFNSSDTYPKTGKLPEKITQKPKTSRKLTRQSKNYPKTRISIETKKSPDKTNKLRLLYEIMIFTNIR